MKAILKGKIVQIFPTEVVGQNATKKRNVRIDISENGINSVVDVTLLHDKVDVADKLNIGDDIEVTCSIMGNLHRGQDGVERCFINLNAYRVAFLQKTVL